MFALMCHLENTKQSGFLCFENVTINSVFDSFVFESFDMALIIIVINMFPKLEF